MTRPDSPRPFDPADRARREARRLLRDLRGEDVARSRAAELRFLRLRSLAAETTPSLRERARLKHALAVVAEERGHESWPALERALVAPPPAFHAPCLGGFLLRWFADADEAAMSLRTLGGYLLPYGDQCFVCEAETVRELGLDPEDPDWRAVAFDLVRPADDAARERLFQKRRAAIRAGIAVPVARERAR